MSQNRPKESIRAAILRRPKFNQQNSHSGSQNQRPTTSVIRAKKREPEPKPEPLQQSYLNDQKYIDLREKVWKKGNFKNINDEDLQNLVSHLLEYSSQCAIHEDYTTAMYANDLALKGKNEIQKRTNDLSSKESQQKKKSQEEDDNKAHQQAYEKFTERNKQIDNEYAERLKKLQEKQNADREKFDDKWTNEMPNKYRKPSTKLLQMKTIEKVLANGGDFEQAQEVHKRADARMKEEAQIAQHDLDVEYKSANRKFMKQQKIEKDALESWYENQKAISKAQYDHDVDIAEKRKTVNSLKRSDENKTTYKRASTSQRTAMISRMRASEPLQCVLLPPLIPPTHNMSKTATVSSLGEKNNSSRSRKSQTEEQQQNEAAQNKQEPDTKNSENESNKEQNAETPKTEEKHEQHNNENTDTEKEKESDPNIMSQVKDQMIGSIATGSSDTGNSELFQTQKSPITEDEAKKEFKEDDKFEDDVVIPPLFESDGEEKTFSNFRKINVFHSSSDLAKSLDSNAEKEKKSENIPEWLQNFSDNKKPMKKMPNFTGMKIQQSYSASRFNLNQLIANQQATTTPKQIVEEKENE